MLHKRIITELGGRSECSQLQWLDLEPQDAQDLSKRRWGPGKATHVGKSVSKGTDVWKYGMGMESCFYSRGSCKHPGRVLRGWSWERGQENEKRGDHFRALGVGQRPGVKERWSMEATLKKIQWRWGERMIVEVWSRVGEKYAGESRCVEVCEQIGGIQGIEKVCNASSEAKSLKRKKMDLRAPNAGAGFGKGKCQWNTVMKNTLL